MTKRCKVKDCGKVQKRLTRGFCSKHYARWWRHGNALYDKPRIPWNKGKKGVQVGANKGKKFSKEICYKLSLSHKGQHSSRKTEFQKGDVRITGKNAHSWKGGITPLNEKIRKSIEYKLWRIAIFERDNYTCIWCGEKSGKLNADHIKPFALFPELRFAIDNGRTLCESCHRKTKTYGWKGALWS